MLMGVFGNIEMAKLQLPGDHPSHPPLMEAHQALESVRQLTSRLLTFAKGGSPILKTFNLQQLLESTISFHLSGSRISTEFDLPGDLWQVKADKGQISQVVANLTINARQAMPAGGTIHIKAANLQDPGEKEAAGLSGHFVKLIIRDEGTGIPDNILERIFDPYFTTKQTGSGLGLAVAHSIIEGHGGHIIVQSVPGEGTTFNIYIPADLTPADKEEADNVSSIGEQAQKTFRILLMDDEAMLRRVGSRMIESCGCQVETASDGEEAVRIYSEAARAGRRFDAVIMDLTVPGGMGGEEALKELLKLDPEARVIVTSGYSADQVLSDYRKHGFSGCLAKPFKMDELKQEIMRVVKKGN
jgi:CheY-like chemotaxis protein